MDPFAYVRPGDRVIPSAARERAIAEAVRAKRRGEPPGTRTERPRGVGEVLVRNDAGVDLGAGAVLAIAGALGDDSGTPVLLGEVPNASHQAFVVLTEAIPAGAAGWAVASGPVCVNVVGAGDYAVMQAGDTTALHGAARGSAQVILAGEPGAVLLDNNPLPRNAGLAVVLSLTFVPGQDPYVLVRRHGSTFASLSSAPIGNVTGRYEEAELLGTARFILGELVWVEWDEVLERWHVQKLLTKSIAWTATPGQVAVRLWTHDMGTNDGFQTYGHQASNFLLDLTQVTSEIAPGSDAALRRVAFRFGGYLGFGGAGRYQSCPVPMGSGWNLCEPVAWGATLSDAVLAAAAASSVTLTNSQADAVTCPVSFNPVGAPTGHISLAYGTQAIAAGTRVYEVPSGLGTEVRQITSLIGVVYAQVRGADPAFDPFGPTGAAAWPSLPTLPTIPDSVQSPYILLSRFRADLSHDSTVVAATPNRLAPNVSARRAVGHPNPLVGRYDLAPSQTWSPPTGVEPWLDLST